MSYCLVEFSSLISPNNRYLIAWLRMWCVSVCNFVRFDSLRLGLVWFDFIFSSVWLCGFLGAVDWFGVNWNDYQFSGTLIDLCFSNNVSAHTSSRADTADVVVHPLLQYHSCSCNYFWLVIRVSFFFCCCSFSLWLSQLMYFGCFQYLDGNQPKTQWQIPRTLFVNFAKFSCVCVCVWCRNVAIKTKLVSLLYFRCDWFLWWNCANLMLLRIRRRRWRRSCVLSLSRALSNSHSCSLTHNACSNQIRCQRSLDDSYKIEPIANVSPDE